VTEVRLCSQDHDQDDRQRNDGIAEQNSEDDDPDEEHIEKDDSAEKSTAGDLAEFVKSQSSSFPACSRNALQQLKRMPVDPLCDISVYRDIYYIGKSFFVQ
jgi:hypothetical protein